MALVSFAYDDRGGGGVVAVKNLAAGLIQHGIQVVIITTQSLRSVQIERHSGLKIIRFRPANIYPVLDKDKQPTWKKIVWQLIDTWNPQVHMVLKNLIQDETPDVVHVHKFRGLSSAVWTASKAAGVDRLVHTCHDYEAISPEGLLQGRVGKWVKNKALAIRPYQAIRRFASKAVDVVTAPSAYTLDLIRGYQFFPNASCSVIPNSHGMQFVEIEDLKNQQLSKRRSSDRPLQLLYLGRIEPEKGIDILCQVVNTCNQRPVKLDVAGWGSIENRLRKEYGSSSNIRFLGVLDGEDKTNALENCDVVVVPSIVPEVFGIVIAEAYAHGKPVIASRIGGIPEYVKDGISGWLVNPGDIEDLSHVIQKLPEEAKHWQEVSENCFDSSKSMALEPVAEKFLSLYEMK